MRQTFKNIFLILTILLIILPFLATFSEQLTALIQVTPIYVLIQKYIVPYEIGIVGAVLTLFKIPTVISPNSLFVNGQKLLVSWNCIGWQSVFFLIVTFFTGLQGKFTLSSKLEAAGIGILGTFWLNILRMIFIAILGGYFPSAFVVVFHDYLAALMTSFWLFLFWWFVYKYLLVTRSVPSS